MLYDTKQKKQRDNFNGRKLAAFCLVVLFGILVVLPGRAEIAVDVQVNTLENQTVLTGEAKPGSEIHCEVYSYDERGRQALLYQKQEKVGASGHYAITVSLPVLGRQYVNLLVNEQETVYAYTRYKKQLVNELKGYYLNIYEVLERGGV